MNAFQNKILKETTVTNQSKPYEPLTADNAALILVDHQIVLMTGVRDYETGELKRNVVALAKAAKVRGLPTNVTTTPLYTISGPNLPELVEVLGQERISDPTSLPAW